VLVDNDRHAKGAKTIWGKSCEGPFLLSPSRRPKKRRLEKLAAMPDEKIDLSDMPELDDAFWRNAVRNPFYRPLKKQLTLRLDADVVAWLRREGKGYQTRANALLRQAMLQDVRKKAS
jgi:uncharacterized protein (DUF4415 family)